MRYVTLAALTTSLAASMPATAQEIDIIAEVAAASALFDRGEQISGPAVETTLAAATGLAAGEIYGAVYRLTPVGSDQAAFADEFDYTIGYAWAADGYFADISANWLTFPGSSDEASLELAGELALDAALSPTLIGFYDVDLEDMGLELSMGPSWNAGAWSGYAIGRLGVVDPGDGSDGRTYYGLEAGLNRPVNDSIEIGGFARYERSDQETFADDIARSNIVSLRDDGLSVGLYLSVSP